jgi:hypothetical protein
VDDVPILGRDDERNLLKLFLAQYDAPAYVRRACQVQEAFDQLLALCRRQRHEWLAMTRIRLGILQALTGAWSVLGPWLRDEEQIKVLQHLWTLLEPELRVPVEPTSSPRTLRRALHELTESIERFNQRWLPFLENVDLIHVNTLREGYNRYFVLEKECAIRSPRLARQAFRRLEPLTYEELAVLFPPLPVPQLQE